MLGASDISNLHEDGIHFIFNLQRDFMKTCKMGKLSKILLNSILFYSVHANSFTVTNCSNDVSTLPDKDLRTMTQSLRCLETGPSLFSPWIPASMFFESQFELRELCLWKSMKLISSTTLTMTVHTAGIPETRPIQKQSQQTI